MKVTTTTEKSVCVVTFKIHKQLKINKMNIKKLALSSSESKLLKSIIRRDSRGQISGGWTIFLCALVFVIMFYIVSTTFEYNPEDLTVSRLINFIYGPSELLENLKKYPPNGIFHTIFDYPISYFLWLVFQIPHTVMTVFFFYNVFISFYLPFKKNYSIRDFLSLKEESQSLLDAILENENNLTEIDTLLSEIGQQSTSLQTEIAEIQLSLSKKDFLKTDEINSLKQKLAEQKELVKTNNEKIESLNYSKKEIQKKLNTKKQLEEEINFLDSLVENLRVKHLA